MQKKAAEKPFPRELEITYVRGDSEGSRREKIADVLYSMHQKSHRHNLVAK